MEKTPANKNQKSPSDYTNHEKVLDCLKQLKTQFGENYERLLVSDTLDAEGHQYVNLVQKGGGVLGVALVGYTYILEQVGIRFLRLAGTSAGAINTAMLTVIGNKNESKSVKILEYLSELNFFNLVDGHPVAKWLIKNIITHKQFEKRVGSIARNFGILFLVLIVLDFVLLALSAKHSYAVIPGMVCYILTSLLLLLLVIVVVYSRYLYSRLKESGYGINPGKFFYNWLKSVMDENSVSTISALNKKAEALPLLQVRNPDRQNSTTLKGDVTFITAELVSQNKIEFPRMYALFRDTPDALHPAGFVRASMSIPVFFESFIIENIPQNQAIKQAWTDFFSTDTTVPATARFVDGGMLSDFPINIFYNPKIIEPRLPSFGIDLDDSKPADPKIKTAQPSSWNLLSYLGRMFNTIRFYYDKDFLIKNHVFIKGIGSIKLSDFNWLNFFITEEDKLNMFIRGAEAACLFLKTFDWKQYQQDRIRMQEILNEKQRPEAIENKSKDNS